MANFREMDLYFFLDVVLVFLMVNYNMPLATLYFGMVISGSFIYYALLDRGVLKAIPPVKTSKDRFPGVLIGIAAGVGFIWFYNWLQTSAPIGQVFATTAFGDSEFLGQLVFGVLVAVVETRFFFRTILQWLANRFRLRTNVSPFSVVGIQLMFYFSAIFTLFHLTAKGVTNNIDLLATFLFGAVQIGMVLFFQQWIEAAVMHVTVNSYGVGIVDSITNAITTGALFANTWFIIAAVSGILYYMFSVKKVRLPGI